MGVAIPLLVQYAFIVWCSFKKEAQDQLHLLPLPDINYVDRLSVF